VKSGVLLCVSVFGPVCRPTLGEHHLIARAWAVRGVC
jgi:hypothetical protein